MTSTIHEMLWGLIRIYQKELVDIHKAHLQDELKGLIEKLNDEDDSVYKVYAKLDQDQKDEFIQYSIDNKSNFYDSIDYPAAKFKECCVFDGSPEFLSDLLRNVSNFKEITKALYTKISYEDCVERINAGVENEVVYDVNSNSDRLQYMKFSHDTLLKYSVNLIRKFPLLRRVIVDKYPYIFIDEYQDTHPSVIEIMSKLSQFSTENDRYWLVGYFGDTAQNIYDEGVGGDVENIHPNLKNINKNFNRRSHKQIIDIANKIRADEISQKPIDDQKNNGIVEFYHNNTSDVVKVSSMFLDSYKEALPAGSKIHCLVLTNKTLAQMAGFGVVYEGLSSGDDIYWNEANVKILSHQLEKLHPAILLMYKLVSLNIKLHDDNTTYYDLLGPLQGQLSFKSASSSIAELKKIEAASLLRFINRFSNLLDSGKIDRVVVNAIYKNLSIDTLEMKNLRMFNNLLTFVETNAGEVYQHACESEQKARELFNWLCKYRTHWGLVQGPKIYLLFFRTVLKLFSV